MNKCILSLVLSVFIFQATAQKKNDSFRLNIRKATGPIVIDGEADDEAWNNTDKADDFYMVLPMDKGKANERSEIRMAYDDKHFYLVAIFYNTVKGPNYVESLRRDFSFGKNDNFLVFIDPFNNQTTGFSFGTNAAGAQWDGTMYAGGKVDLNWDNKWISEVKRSDDKWVFEMAVPFKSIRYKDGVKEWGINFSRLDLKSSEKSSWTPVPRQFPTASLAYTGVLVWDTPPPSQGANISIIPYVLANSNRDDQIDNKTNYDTKVGGDVKIGLTAALNLDLTVNPDFSQVEVDREVTNLDRYELFFPEKRQFFLENADLFANFGYPNIRPFFSRRIGLGVPIDLGARVSGNLSENWRLGIMDMQTAAVSEVGLPKQNFGVLSLQRKVFSRSSIGLMFVDKESINYSPEDPSSENTYSKFNRNVGLEYNLASPNNLWTGKAFMLKSFSPDQLGNGITQAAHLEYKSRKWNWRIQEESVEEDYIAEVGFVPRNGYIKISSLFGHLFFPEKGKIVSHGPQISTDYYFDQAMNKTDDLVNLEYLVSFRNRSSFSLELLNENVELLAPFDPTRSGKDSLAIGTKHHWNAWRLNYLSKPQSMFRYTFSSHMGGYYEGGSRFNITNEMSYRFQPYVSLSSNLSYNFISLPEPWDDTEFWLIGSKVDVTFTNKLFFATLFQYNEQSKKFNLNSQFQWRYKPASDLYIVYSNNYLLAPYTGRNWALTFKLTYWFNK